MFSTNDNKFMRLLVDVVVYSMISKRIVCWRLKLTSSVSIFFR